MTDAGGSPAHYDSVPGTPGADDNASALAVCLNVPG
jgi:Zn-dependent M28 family amino/carboxypeptidase